MKTIQIFRNSLPVLALAALSLNGCSTLRGGKTSAGELSTTGPNVVSVKTVPSTINLNKDLTPQGQAAVVAEVKDFTSPVTDVRLRFDKAPLEIPMQHLGGTTWQANLTPQQLKTLAVSGKKMEYKASVIAKNQDGLTAVSNEPVNVVIKAPEQTKTG